MFELDTKARAGRLGRSVLGDGVTKVTWRFKAIAAKPKAFDEVSGSRPEIRQGILQELDAVCVEPLFAKSPGSVRLLRFLVERDIAGAASSLRETYIGAALYGRDQDYDPKLDGIVRVNANRLRTRLQEHYWKHPARQIELILRPGSYVPLYRFVTAEPGPPNQPPELLPILKASPPLDDPIPVPPAAATMERERQWIWAAAAVLAVLVAAISLRPHKGAMQSSAYVWTSRPLTRFNGQQEFPAFSPDGHTVAFVWAGAGRAGHHIYLLNVDGGVPERLTANAQDEGRPAWSPDGRSIAYARLFPEGHKQIVIRNIISGTERIVAAIDGRNPWLCALPRLAWSPDAQTLYTSALPTPAEDSRTEICRIIALDVATGARRQLTRSAPGVIGDLEAAVSPDGSRLAFMRNFSYLSSDLFSIPVGGGNELRLTSDDNGILGFSWDVDGQSLIASSRRVDGQARLWRMPTDRSMPEQITDGSVGPWFPAITRQGDRIAFTVFRSITKVWRQSAEGREELVAYGTSNSKPQLSPDGKQVLYTGEHSGAPELWLTDVPGGQSRQLTHMGGYPAFGGSWSPDGRQIVFECRDQQHSAICLIASDGSGGVQRLTNDIANHIQPSWSRNGRFLYYAANTTGRWEIYRKPVTGGGAPMQITFNGAMRALESWDGQFLYVHRGEPRAGLLRLPTASFGRGPLPQEQTPFLPVPGWAELQAWSVGKDGVLVLEKQVGKEPGALVLYRSGMHDRQVLYKVSGIPDYSGFSVAGDGTTICYATEEGLNGELDLLERKQTP